MKEAAEATRRRQTILVVDDERSIRESLRLVLTDDYDVHTAERGRDALGRLDSLQPDLVLLDIMMPGLDGLAVLERIKADHPDIVVVMVTAITTAKTIVEAMRHGADDYVAKPFEIAEIKLVIERALERRALPDEVHRLRNELA